MCVQTYHNEHTAPEGRRQLRRIRVSSVLETSVKRCSNGCVCGESFSTALGDVASFNEPEVEVIVAVHPAF